MREIGHIRLRVPEPGALTRLLFGDGVPPAWLRVETGLMPRIVAWSVSDSSAAASFDGPRAVILATVDADRAAGELGAQFGDGWTDTGRDDLLGANCRRLPVGRSLLVLAEPSTEGYTAACLARFGEGPIGVAMAAPAGVVPAGGRHAARNPVDDGSATYLRIGPGTAPTFILLSA